jgi:hypothetical protein
MLCEYCCDKIGGGEYCPDCARDVAAKIEDDFDAEDEYEEYEDTVEGLGIFLLGLYFDAEDKYEEDEDW